jgi:DNA-directed RNA polymerase subunit beta'
MKMVKNRDKRAEDVLQEVVKSHPVEMNRAPTLHKFNIMAFEPVLVQGHAIQVHPSVCPGFGADFDGDTVNIHVPVSDNARREALEKMRPSRNLMAPSNRKIMYKPEKEYMQGLYIATRMAKDTGRPVIFRTLQEAKEAYRSGGIDIDTPIRIMEQQ